MARLYSIVGVINEPLIGIHPFGGFFNAFLERDTRNLEFPFEGMLIDNWGHSKIEGTLTPYDLKFNKIDKGRTDVLEYSFKKRENEMWFGDYHNNTCGFGKAVCSINPFLDNLKLGIANISTEQWAHDLVDNMVKTGRLKKVKDPETGEDLISLA